MKQSTKFTPEYKKKLSANIKDLTKYLESKTGYKIKMAIELDNNFGYLYSVKISLDNEFSKFAKWVLYSTGKQNIKNELLENIAHFDWKHKKLGGTTKKITKRVKSTALKIECCNCGEEVNVNAVHRNIKSDMYKSRNGYVLYCHDCTIKQFSEIFRKRDIYIAFVWICAFYDRQYIRSLIDTVKKLPLSPFDMVQEYFRRINLTQYKGKLFADSDLLVLTKE